MKRIIKKVRLNSIRSVDLERDPLQWWIKSVRRVEKSENFFHPAVQLLLWLYRAQ